MAHFDAGNFSNAISDLSIVIRRQPGDHASLRWRGHSYAAIGNWTEAIDDFSQAVRIIINTDQTGYLPVVVAALKRWLADVYRARSQAYEAIRDRARSAQDLKSADELEAELRSNRGLR